MSGHCFVRNTNPHIPVRSVPVTWSVIEGHLRSSRFSIDMTYPSGTQVGDWQICFFMGKGHLRNTTQKITSVQSVCYARLVQIRNINGSCPTSLRGHRSHSKPMGSGTLRRQVCDHRGLFCASNWRTTAVTSFRSRVYVSQVQTPRYRVHPSSGRESGTLRIDRLGQPPHSCLPLQRTSAVISLLRSPSQQARPLAGMGSG